MPKNVKKTVAGLTKELIEKAGNTRTNEVAGIFGVASKENIMQTICKAAAELGIAVAEAKPYDEVMELHEKMAGAVDTAAVTGVIGETELPEFYALTDDIWAAIEKEKA